MIPTPMQYSVSGLALTGRSEGCKLTAYQDPGGVWTNGYGNTHGVVPWSTISQEQALSDLRANVQNSVNDVNQLVNVQLTQGEFDALVDFDYNLGRGALGRSTLLVNVNAQNWAAAAKDFEAWDLCDGKKLAGLFNRRVAEEKEFQS